MEVLRIRLLEIRGYKRSQTRHVRLRTSPSPAQTAALVWSSCLRSTSEGSVGLASEKPGSPVLSVQVLCHLRTTSRGGTEGRSTSLHRYANGMEVSQLA